MQPAPRTLRVKGVSFDSPVSSIGRSRICSELLTLEEGIGLGSRYRLVTEARNRGFPARLIASFRALSNPLGSSESN